MHQLLQSAMFCSKYPFYFIEVILYVIAESPPGSSGKEGQGGSEWYHKKTEYILKLENAKNQDSEQMSLQKDKNFWRFFCAHLVMRIYSTKMYCEGSEELMEQHALEPSQIQIQ